MDNYEQAVSDDCHFSSHTHSHKKLSAKVRIGSDRNYTFPIESKFSNKQSNSPPALLARGPLFAGMNETNNYDAGDDNEVFPGNDNMTKMTMMAMIMMLRIQKKMGVSHSKPMFPFAHPSTSQGSQRLHGQGVWGSFYK